MYDSKSSRVLKPRPQFKRAKDNKTEINSLFCFICRQETNQKTKRFDNPRSVFYHLHEFHRNDPSLNFALEILDSVSIAIDAGILK